QTSALPARKRPPRRSMRGCSTAGQVVSFHDPEARGFSDASGAADKAVATGFQRLVVEAAAEFEAVLASCAGDAERAFDFFVERALLLFGVRFRALHAFVPNPPAGCLAFDGEHDTARRREAVGDGG